MAKTKLEARGGIDAKNLAKAGFWLGACFTIVILLLAQFSHEYRVN